MIAKAGRGDDRPLRMIKFERILVAVDFSQDCRAALECGAGLARQADATLTLLHVCEPFPVLNPIVPGADNAKDEERERRGALTQLDNLRNWLAENGIAHVRVEVETGSPAEALITRANSGAFDLVVMGTHGRSGVSRLMMGSVAESVTRHAHCPVLTVHLPPATSS